jgi:hypothetical protein
VLKLTAVCAVDPEKAMPRDVIRVETFCPCCGTPADDPRQNTDQVKARPSVVLAERTQALHALSHERSRHQRVSAPVTLGKVVRRVVRHLEDGFASEFTRLLHGDFLEKNVTGE